jgi:hypothetical protein
MIYSMSMISLVIGCFDLAGRLEGFVGSMVKRRVRQRPTNAVLFTGRSERMATRNLVPLRRILEVPDILTGAAL